MKFIKVIIAIIIVGALLAIVYTSNNSTVPKFSNTYSVNNAAIGSTSTIDAQYKELQDDRDTVSESNAQLVITIQELKKEIKNISDKVTDNTYLLNNKPTPKNQKDIYKPVDNTDDNNVVTDIKNKVNKAIGTAPFDIGGAYDEQTITTNALQTNYIWVQGLQSSTSSVQNNILEESAQDIFKDEENTNIPIYTIPTNAILSGVLVTEMLGRIPIDGKVTDHYRFSVRINTKSLFASFKQHNELKGMILSGVTQGDLLLSCATGVLDSATFIFDDGTISQNDISNMAIIIDDYGKPCIKGKLITNAPTYLSISTGLSALSAAAEAVASGEQTTSVDANGNKTESLTGDAVKFAKFNAISGGASNVSQWLDTRAQSTFDVIQVQSGIGVKILTHTNINIDYNPKGRKLTYSNNSSEQSPYDTLD